MKSSWKRTSFQVTPKISYTSFSHSVIGFSNSFEEVDIKTLRVGPRIGKGSYAEVFKAVWRGTEVAVKRLPAHMLSEEFFQDFEREADLMRYVTHFVIF